MGTGVRRWNGEEEGKRVTTKGIDCTWDNRGNEIMRMRMRMGL